MEGQGSEFTCISICNGGCRGAGACGALITALVRLAADRHGHAGKYQAEGGEGHRGGSIGAGLAGVFIILHQPRAGGLAEPGVGVHRADADALVGVDGQHLGQQVAALGAELAAQGHVHALHDGPEQRGLGVALEGRLPHQQLVQDDAQAPYVDGRAVVLLACTRCSSAQPNGPRFAHAATRAFECCMRHRARKALWSSLHDHMRRPGMRM